MNMKLLNRLTTMSDGSYAVFMTVVYALLVCTISSFHEVWRDEVVPITMVLNSCRLSDLIAGMHNYGHPGLWITLLFGAFQLVPKLFVLKIVNLLVSILGVFVFLKTSPFSRFQKTLFLFGLFPFYIYPVINRSYALSMLLIFLFSTLYIKRFDKVIVFSAVLFLLANTHVHSLIFVIAVFASLTLEFVFDAESRSKWCGDPLRLLVGFSIVVTGILVSVVQIVPDSSSIIYHPHFGPQNIFRALVSGMFRPGNVCPDVFGAGGAFFSTLVIAAVYVLILRKPYVLCMAVTTVIGLNLFYYLIYGSLNMRQQGAFFLLFIAVLWIERLVKPVDRPFKGILAFLDRLSIQLSGYRSFILTVVLILQIGVMLPALRNELTREYSHSRKLSIFLESREDLKDALIVSEPGYIIESLVYYRPRPYYFPREERLAWYDRFTKDNRLELDLTELMTSVERLRQERRVPIVVVLGHELSAEGPFNFEFGYHQKFHYSPESLRVFLSKTRKMASFRGAISDENYDVYLFN